MKHLLIRSLIVSLLFVLPVRAQDQAAQTASEEEKARQFVKTYPGSRKAEDSIGLVNIGLSEAALSGDTGAAEELQRSAAAALKDPKLPEQLKLHAFMVNHVTRWAIASGKRTMDP